MPVWPRTVGDTFNSDRMLSLGSTSRGLYFSFFLRGSNCFSGRFQISQNCAIPLQSRRPHPTPPCLHWG